MAGLIYKILSSSTLLSVGLYHTICTTRNHHKSIQSYSAKPHHHLPIPHHHHHLKHLQLFLLILSFLIAFAHQILVATDFDPLLKGHTPIYYFASFQSTLILFLLLALSLLLSKTTSLLLFPSDLFFTLTASIFYLQYSISSTTAFVQTSDLQAKCDIISGRISTLSAFLCTVLICQPKLFIVDVALGGSLCMQGLWVLQTDLPLYIEAFIPEGCHKLVDVVNGVEGSTKCDLEESKLRAMAILDFLFLVYLCLCLLLLLILDFVFVILGSRYVYVFVCYK